MISAARPGSPPGRGGAVVAGRRNDDHTVLGHRVDLGALGRVFAAAADAEAAIDDLEVQRITKAKDAVEGGIDVRRRGHALRRENLGRIPARLRCNAAERREIRRRLQGNSSIARRRQMFHRSSVAFLAEANRVVAAGGRGGVERE